MMEEKFNNYMDFVRNARSFNSSLCNERKFRIPYIENQTGIAQQGSLLWKTNKERQQVTSHGVLYSYPAMRWQKRRREYLMNETTLSNPTMTATASNPSSSNIGPKSHRVSIDLNSGTSYSCRETTKMHPSSIEQLGNSSRKRAPSLSSSTTLSCSSSSSSSSSSSTSSSTIIQLGPTRADSTGSHSCITMDSDSRDLSSATSQTFDSPSRHQLSSELPEIDTSGESTIDCNKGIKDNTSEVYDSLVHSFPIKKESARCLRKENNFASKNTTSSDACKKLFHSKDEDQFADQSHGKKTKKRNVGQSLMKTMDNCEKDKNVNQKSHRVNKNGQLEAQDKVDPIQTRREESRNVSETVANKASMVIKEEKDQKFGFSIGTSSEESVKHEDETKLENEESLACNLVRPYICSICDQSYKTRPGLSYHFMHTHNKVLPKSTANKTKIKKITSTRDPKVKLDESKQELEVETRLEIAQDSTQQYEAKVDTNQEETTPLTLLKTSPPSTDGLTQEKDLDQNLIGKDDDDETVIDELSDEESLEKRIDAIDHTDVLQENKDQNEKEETLAEELNSINAEPTSEDNQNLNLTDELTPEKFEATQLDIEPKVTKSNPYCDFCLGTVEKNRRTRLPEVLISCSRCGSSGHPTCLQFSQNITQSVQKYDWQCIECKTCSTCDQANHEDQLLFCDDCDRSYHTYCLKPPLLELPEGNWSCSSCLAEYHHRQEE